MFAVLAILVGCGNDPSEQGGAGTDAGNALTVFARGTDGAPISGASVEIRPIAEIPDSASAPAFVARTGADGTTLFHLPAGTWSVLVRQGDQASWNQAGSVGRVTGVLDSVARLQGTLRGAGGMRVAMRGMGLWARCDTAGMFALDNVPAGRLPLVVVHGDGRVDSTRVPLSPRSDVWVSGSVDSLPSLLDTTQVQLDYPPRS